LRLDVDIYSLCYWKLLKDGQLLATMSEAVQQQILSMW